MRAIELFAGAGGLSMGLERAGIDVIAHAEIEPNARAVLRHKWPRTELLGDVSQIDGTRWRGMIDLVAGGSPCQDLSVAGKRAGLTGARSSLFHQQVRLWDETDATYCLWENVLGAFSSQNGRDFACVLSAFVGAALPVPTDGWESSGVAAGPTGVAAWRVLDLQHFGPPQRRRRVFVLAARAGGADPAEVLAVSESLCGHPAPRERTREGAARGAGAGVAGGGGGSAVAFVPTAGAWGVSAGSVSPAIKVGSGVGIPSAPAVLAFHVTQDPISDTKRSPSLGATTSGMGVVTVGGDVTHALTHDGHDASEDGTGRGTPIVANTITAREAKGWNPARDVGNGTVTAGRPRRLTPLECERLMGWPDGHTKQGVDETGARYNLTDSARYRLCGNGVGTPVAEWIGRQLMAHDAALRAQEAA